MLHDSTHIKHLEGKFIETESGIVVSRGGGERGLRSDCLKVIKCVFGMIKTKRLGNK